MYILHRHMNVEIGTEAALFPEKEYINGISFAVSGAWMDLVGLVESSRDATIVDKSGMGITAMEFLRTLSEGEQGGRERLLRSAGRSPSLCSCRAFQPLVLPLTGKPSLNDSSLTDGPRTTRPQIVDPLKRQIAWTIHFQTFGPYFLLQRVPRSFRGRRIWIVDTFYPYFWQPPNAFLEGWAEGVHKS
jgi:hypothetical protein